MRLILTGATGFVGGEVLDQALKDPSIGRVTVLTRRPLGRTAPKLKEIVLRNFLDYSSVRNDLQADACIWCLGVSQTQVSRDEYVKITYDYAMRAAEAMFAVNPELNFCFLSGARADHEEKSRVYYGKIKGRTERELLKLKPARVYSFRPGFIAPAYKGQKRPLITKIFTPAFLVADRLTDHNASVSCRQLARCLLDVAKRGSGQHVLDNRTIHYWA